MLNKINVNERYKICKNIFEIFKSNNISYAVIKGVVLSKMIHNDIYHRKSGDIDILINRKDIDEVKQIMLDNNFIQGHVDDNGIIPFTRNELIFQSTMSHQMAPFIRKTDNQICPYVNVDINFDIIWGECKSKCDMDYVLNHIDFIEICGIIVNKLSPEMEFAALCLHHYKDMNSIYLLSQGSLKLDLFDDIYHYIKRVALDINKLKSISNYLDISEYIYYCLYYTNEIYNDELFIKLLTLLKTESASVILNTFGLAEDEVNEWQISFSERLNFEILYEYLNANLSENNLNKIKINKNFM